MIILCDLHNLITIHDEKLKRSISQSTSNKDYVFFPGNFRFTCKCWCAEEEEDEEEWGTVQRTDFSQQKTTAK